MTTAPVSHDAHLIPSLPRYHPIAINPSSHPDMMQNHHFRHFALHDPQTGPPPAPPAPAPSSLDQIEARLRQLEHEEMNRMAARTHLLAVRKREDEEFRRMTEHAEAEEDDLRRQRKRIKRESMGLGGHGNPDSPPLRPSPPRRLSETSAATTLAFFKQQSPPEPRQTPLPQVSQPSMHPPIHLHQQHHQQSQLHQHQHQHQQHQHQQHQHHHISHHQQHQKNHHHPHPHPPHPIVAHDHINGGGSIRRKQKYTIKNVEAWGERHGRPAAHDPSGRALWKRPSDSSLVYLACPIQGCAKSDFVTLHGFMCHLTKKHKDRTLGSQSRALELCGIAYDPNAPLPPMSSTQRSSTEESPLDQMAMEGDDSHLESESEESDERDEPYTVKTETIERSLPDADESSRDTPPFTRPSMNMNGSAKHSISSLIDRTPELEHRESLASLAASDSAMTQAPTPVSMEQSVVPAKRKYEYTPPSEKENTEPENSVE